MTTEIKVPALGESVTEATVAKWFKSVGDPVRMDEAIVELETDKVTLEVNAQAAGTVLAIEAETGANVAVGAVLALIAEGDVSAPSKIASVPGPEAAPAPEATPAPTPAPMIGLDALGPAARKLVEANALNPAAIPATGPDGRLTKGDVLAYLDSNGHAPIAEAPSPALPEAPVPAPVPAPAAPAARGEERVRITRLRTRIAERLKEAQNTAAMLSTFNEVDMTAVMAARERFRDQFEKKHGVRLGFMSFFAKATVIALKEIPTVNAQIDGQDIVYKHYCDIGVAVGTEQGLVVPVLRDVDRLGFAEIEKGIADLGVRAREGKLALDELSGGTFTITNSGVYGSLLSTPILNPPQSGILGMHKIENRPMAVGEDVVVRPMMYLALSYDHRIVDGREAVTFLVRVKECIEDPERILLDI